MMSRMDPTSGTFAIFQVFCLFFFRTLVYKMRRGSPEPFWKRSRSRESSGPSDEQGSGQGSNSEQAGNVDRVDQSTPVQGARKKAFRAVTTETSETSSLQSLVQDGGCSKHCLQAVPLDKLWRRLQALAAMTTEEKRRFISLELLNSSATVVRGKPCLCTR